MSAATIACAQTASVDTTSATVPACSSRIDVATIAPLTQRLLTPGQRFNLAGLPPTVLAQANAMQKSSIERQAHDFPDLCRYRAENTAMLHGSTRPDTVFLGDSITELWKLADPSMFGAKSVDRGISGQTTQQILLRFYQDVVDLHPRIVHILAGTNDIAGNTGPVPDDVIVEDIHAMLDIAAANNIKVILAGITPVDTKERPAERVRRLNIRLRNLATVAHVTYLDYAIVLGDAGGGIKLTLANDGLHPNRDGFARMRSLAQKAIAEKLKS